MRRLILLLVLAVPVQAQTLADAARMERARQARIRSSQVITGKGTQTQSTVTPPTGQTTPPAAPTTGTPAPEAGPGAPAQEPPKPAARPTPTPAPAAPAVDPAAKWNAEANRLRAKIQELQDQERAVQLQINQLTNQFFAPVSDQNSRDQAQARLSETQNKLTAVRAELDQTKKALDAMQLQGPPKQ